AAEVRVDHGFGDAGRLRNLIHRAGVEPLAGEDAYGRVEHLLLPDRPGQPTRRDCGHAGQPTYRYVRLRSSNVATWRILCPILTRPASRRSTPPSSFPWSSRPRRINSRRPWPASTAARSWTRCSTGSP